MNSVDTVLIGTGLAPLVTAIRCLQEGQTVALVNPHRDYFLEDTELPLDLTLSDGAFFDQIQRESLDHLGEMIRRPFPGPLEWVKGAEPISNHEGAWLRARNRIRVQRKEVNELSMGRVHALEELYLKLSEVGVKAQWLEGWSAVKSFPGINLTRVTQQRKDELERYVGLWIPRGLDLSIDLYRMGILDFLREKLDSDHLLLDCSQITLQSGGLRFVSGGQVKQIRAERSVLVYWTPALSHWIKSESQRLGVSPRSPVSLRPWEEWSVISRDPIALDHVGMYLGGMAWAQSPGQLQVLLPGVPGLEDEQPDWVNASSFEGLLGLLQGLLGWERYSIRSLRTHALWDWGDRPQRFKLLSGDSPAWILSDGGHSITQTIDRAWRVYDEL